MVRCCVAAAWRLLHHVDDTLQPHTADACQSKKTIGVCLCYWCRVYHGPELTWVCSGCLCAGAFASLPLRNFAMATTLSC